MQAIAYYEAALKQGGQLFLRSDGSQLLCCCYLTRLHKLQCFHAAKLVYFTITTKNVLCWNTSAIYSIDAISLGLFSCTLYRLQSKNLFIELVFRAWTLLLGHQEGYPGCKQTSESSKVSSDTTAKFGEPENVLTMAVSLLHKCAYLLSLRQTDTHLKALFRDNLDKLAPQMSNQSGF